MDLSFPTFRHALSGNTRLLGWWPLYTTAAQRQSLLRIIAVGIEENLSLIPLLESWTVDERGIQHYRLRRLLQLLNQGRTLPDAIEAVPGILREEDVLAIRFDAQSGTRTAAIREALAQYQLDGQSAGGRIVRPLVYFCIVLPISLMVIAFLQAFIRPKLERIFLEFGAETPPATRLSAHLSDTFLHGGWLLVIVLLLACILLFSTRTGRSIRRAFFGRLVRPLGNWHVANVLQKIALASHAGRPVTGALSTLARYHFDPLIRQELLFVRNEMEQGADIWDSMSTIGMLTRADVRALRTAERIGNRPWVLTQLAEVKRRSSTRRFSRWSEFLLPALVLLLAVLVLFQALTVLEPLHQLIRNLT